MTNVLSVSFNWSSVLRMRPQALVDVLDHGGVDRVVDSLAGLGLVRVLLDFLLLRQHGHMDRVMGEMQKEGPLPVRFDELDRPIGQVVGQIDVARDAWLFSPPGQAPSR